jgi:hypothetical protein
VTYQFDCRTVVCDGAAADCADIVPISVQQLQVYYASRSALGRLLTIHLLHDSRFHSKHGAVTIVCCRVDYVRFCLRHGA